MRPEALLLLGDRIARRLALGWPEAARRWPACADPEQDAGLWGIWAETSGLPETVVETVAPLLLLHGVCVRETGELHPLAVGRLRRQVALDTGLDKRQAGGPRDRAVRDDMKE